MARFVGPHFVTIEGDPDGSGWIRRGCAFTTMAPGWRQDRTGATHFHSCVVRKSSPSPVRHEALAWRTESLALGRGLEDVTLGAQGGVAAAEAMTVAGGAETSLPSAIIAALSAAYQPLSAELDPHGKPLLGTVYVAPAFVEILREPGLPRVWACDFLSQEHRQAADGPTWTHLQSCMIRERPGHARHGFLCEVESLPPVLVMQRLRADSETLPEANSQAGYRALRWSCDSLQSAIAECLRTALAEPETNPTRA